MFSTTLSTHLSSELSPMILLSRSLIFALLTLLVRLHRRRASTAMLLIPSPSIRQQRRSWLPVPQTRLLACGISGTSRPSSTPWKVTQILCSRSRGIPSRSLFWPALAMIGRSCSGISAVPARNRPPRTRRTVLPSCMFYIIVLFTFHYA